VTITETDTAVPHAGVLVLDNFPVALDPHYLLAVLNGSGFWAFVRGTMPTMGEGRQVLRRGPLAGFRVPLASESAQAEVVALTRRLLVTTSASERIRLKGLIDEVVLGCCGSGGGIT
jgi:hypothetical protein